MALLEAQAAGLPVVAGAVGGVPSIVADGITGLLTPPGEAGAFARGCPRLDRSHRPGGPPWRAAAAENVAPAPRHRRRGRDPRPGSGRSLRRNLPRGA